VKIKMKGLFLYNYLQYGRNVNGQKWKTK